MTTVTKTREDVVSETSHALFHLMTPDVQVVDGNALAEDLGLDEQGRQHVRVTVDFYTVVPKES